MRTVSQGGRWKATNSRFRMVMRTYRDLCLLCESSRLSEVILLSKAPQDQSNPLTLNITAHSITGTCAIQGCQVPLGRYLSDGFGTALGLTPANQWSWYRHWHLGSCKRICPAAAPPSTSPKLPSRRGVANKTALYSFRSSLVYAFCAFHSVSIQPSKVH